MRIKILFTVVTVALLTVTGVAAQTSSLPLVLNSVTHSYPSLNVTTVAPGNVNYNLVQLTARDLTFNNAQIDLTNGSISAENIIFGSANNAVNINSTNIRAMGNITIPSAILTLSTLTMKAPIITFNNPAITITVRGDVKIICDELNLGTGTISVAPHAAGGSLTIEYQNIHGTRTISPGANVSVKMVPK